MSGKRITSKPWEDAPPKRVTCVLCDRVVLLAESYLDVYEDDHVTAGRVTFADTLCKECADSAAVVGTIMNSSEFTEYLTKIARERPTAAGVVGHE